MISLPHSWSSLTWEQLVLCWQTKQRYGANADAARAAAFLALSGLSRDKAYAPETDNTTGEKVYRMVRQGEGKKAVCITPRELSYYARKALPWFDFPYGDHGEEEQRDEKGRVVKERREGVAGYVSTLRDAMILPEDKIAIKKGGRKGGKTEIYFQLPQEACCNLTWQQYRSMQVIVPNLFGENTETDRILNLQSQFLAHCLVPETEEQDAGTDKFQPRHKFRYNAERAEATIPFWKERLSSAKGEGVEGTLFHICFQCYQTAVQYYSSVYPLLFSDDGKKDTLRDALQGEVGTVNTVMKYAGYAEQQQVYDSNLPFVLDILNTMAKEAKEIERISAQSKKRK